MTVRRRIQGIDGPEPLARLLGDAQYIADDGLSTAAYLSLALGKPLLLEGAPGVGKTEAAKALASILGRELVRLQCYEGIDASAAMYEWNFPRQMLAIRRREMTTSTSTMTSFSSRDPSSRRWKPPVSGCC